jgi:UrcA family protein
MSLAIKSAFAALVLATAFVPSALAQTSGKTVSVRVAYGDLNVSTAAGGKILLKRIQSAARAACSKAIPRSPLTPRAFTVCRRDTVERSVRDMSIATLTAAWTREAVTTLASR